MLMLKNFNVLGISISELFSFQLGSLLFIIFKYPVQRFFNHWLVMVRMLIILKIYKKWLSVCDLFKKRNVTVTRIMESKLFIPAVRPITFGSTGYLCQNKLAI